MSNTTQVSPGEAPAGSVHTDRQGSGKTAAEHMQKAGPGWYYDPADEAIYRYWDGERWTNRLSDTVTTELPRR